MGFYGGLNGVVKTGNGGGVRNVLPPCYYPLVPPQWLTSSFTTYSNKWPGMLGDRPKKEDKKEIKESEH